MTDEECWELLKRYGLTLESKIKCVGVRKSSADMFDEQMF